MTSIKTLLSLTVAVAALGGTIAASAEARSPSAIPAADGARFVNTSGPWLSGFAVGQPVP